MITENKLQYKSQIDLRIRKKKSGQKKITGFQVHSTEHVFC
jgi:WD repeat-containing protein 44